MNFNILSKTAFKINFSVIKQSYVKHVFLSCLIYLDDKNLNKVLVKKEKKYKLGMCLFDSF